jgi:phosphoglycolate phosphatase-like HAD superfamily hydrolase
VAKTKIFFLDAFGFDVNGTLVKDTPFPFLVIINMMFRRLGLEPVPIDKLRREFGQPWTKVFRVRGISEKEWPDSKLYELYNQLYQSFDQPPLASNAPYILKELKNRGFKLFVVTTQQPAVTVPSLEKILGLFDGAFYGVSDKGRVLETIRTNVGGLVYVGDQVDDVREAKRVGCLAIGYTEGLHPADMLEAAGSDFLVSNFREILNLPISLPFPSS